jgi:SAM-dependent methyltransferase
MNPYTGSNELEVMRLAKNYNSALVELIGTHLPKDGRVLDFGAGNGLFASMLFTEYGIRCDCLEPDPQLAGQIVNSKGHFSVIPDLNSLPKKTYDLIYSLNVLEHIEDDVQVLQQLKSKLKLGGKLLIYVPAFMLLYSNNDKRVGHFRRYTKKTMLKALLNAGLRCDQIEYYDIMGFFAALAYKAVPGNSDGSLSSASVQIFDRLIFPVSKAMNPLSKHLFGKNLLAICTNS